MTLPLSTSTPAARTTGDGPPAAYSHPAPAAGEVGLYRARGEIRQLGAELGKWRRAGRWFMGLVLIAPVLFVLVLASFWQVDAAVLVSAPWLLAGWILLCVACTQQQARLDAANELRNVLAAAPREALLSTLGPLRHDACPDTRQLALELLKTLRTPNELTPADTPAARGDEVSPTDQER